MHHSLGFWIVVAACGFLLFILTDCAGGPRPEKTLAPTCAALVGPLRYNTYVPKSRRYAGPDLAVDLKRRNQIGQALGCPQYRSY